MSKRRRPPGFTMAAMIAENRPPEVPMNAPVTLPLWIIVVLVAASAWTLLVLLLAPGMRWFFRQLDVDYAAGYTFTGDETDTLPPEVEQGVIGIIQEMWSARGRDNYLKSENIPGVYEAQYWVGSLTEPGALPGAVQVLLDPHKLTHFW